MDKKELRVKLLSADVSSDEKRSLWRKYHHVLDGKDVSWIARNAVDPGVRELAEKRVYTLGHTAEGGSAFDSLGGVVSATTQRIS